MSLNSLKAKLYNIQANIAFNKGDTKKALFHLGQAYETGSAKPQTVTTYAYLLLKSGEIDKSMQIFEKQIASYSLPENLRNSAKGSYALALWKKGDLQKAISLLEEILPKYKNTNVYGSLGYFYNINGDLDKALQFNLEAYEYNSTGQVILDNLGQTYFLLGEYDKSKEIFDKLIEMKPTFPEAYYDYALLMEALGERNEALEALDKALYCMVSFVSDFTRAKIEQKLAELSV